MLFTTAAMTVCNLLIFLIFGISESVFPLVDDALSAQIMLRAIRMTITMSVTAAGIGIIATGIGFIKKSVPTTIVAAVLLSSFLCNILFNSTNDVNRSTVTSIIIMCIVLFAGMIVATILMKKVNHMEAE